MPPPPPLLMTIPPVSAPKASPAQPPEPPPITLAPETLAPEPTQDGTRDEGEDSLIGQKPLGQYVIQSKIGEGGFGAVYLATQHGVGRKAVIKVLRQKLAGSDIFVKRFRREAAVLAALDHHHLVRLYNFGELEDGKLFLAMEYGGDRTLEDEIRTCGRLGEARALRITSQVCSALQEAHSRGIVHRDLKPANIMLGQKDGQDWVKVVDVGIAKMLDASDIDDGQTLRTGVGALIGTPAYFSPEQARGTQLDGRSDVYTMGCILYKMLSGKLPVHGKSAVDYLRAHCMEAPIPLRDRGVIVSANVNNTLLKRVLCKDPNDRMTAAQMAEWALAEAKRIETQAPTGKRRYVVAGAAGTLVVLGTIALAVWFLNRDRDNHRARRVVTSTMISSQLMPERTKEPVAPAPVAAPTVDAGPLASPAPPAGTNEIASAPDAGAPVEAAAVPVAPTVAAPAPAATAAPAAESPKPTAAIETAPVEKEEPATVVEQPRQKARPAAAASAAVTAKKWAPKLRKLEALFKANQIPEVIAEAQRMLGQKPPDEVKWQLYKALGVAEYYNGDTSRALKYENLYRPHCPASQLPATDARIEKLRAEAGLGPQ